LGYSDGRQNTYDRDDHQQFNQCKTGLALKTQLFHRQLSLVSFDFFLYWAINLRIFKPHPLFSNDNPLSPGREQNTDQSLLLRFVVISVLDCRRCSRWYVGSKK
jgi:hypothetical protein